MNVARLSLNDSPKEYFTSLQDAGLIGYAKSGYERWSWQYLAPPLSSTFPPASWVFTLDGNKAGHLGGIVVNLKFGSQKISVAWAVDFATAPQYRKRGIGRALVEEADKDFDLLLTAGQTDMSFNLFMKMGWKFIGYIPYQIKIFDIKGLIKGRAKNNSLINILTFPFNLLLVILNHFNQPRKPKEITLRGIDNFSEEADLLWQEISGFYRIVVSRDKEYLHWKYDLQPGMQYIKFRAERNHKVCGYIILRCVENYSAKEADLEGLITDIVVDPGDSLTIEALLFEAVKYFKEKKCHLIRSYINNLKIEKSLKRCGFLKRKPYMRFLINRAINNDPESLNLDNWYLSAGDCDIDR